MFSLSGWEVAGLISKLGIYPGIAAALGGPLVLLFYHDGSRRLTRDVLVYIALAGLLAFHSALAYFLIQVGTISGSGVAGMFDWTMINLLLDTPLGDSSLLRLTSFVAMFLLALFYLYRIRELQSPPEQLFYSRLFALLFLCALIAAGSFRSTGHLAVFGNTAQLAIALHLLAFGTWVGALLPLAWLCNSPDIAQLKTNMQRFGAHARFILIVLLAAGIYMLTELLTTPSDLIATPYGFALSIKLALVGLLLLLAARHRWFLVPALGTQEAGLKLQRSIYVELVVALVLLCVTAYFSTMLAPPAGSAMMAL